jgi:hypothetical protein
MDKAPREISTYPMIRDDVNHQAWKTR